MIRSVRCSTASSPKVLAPREAVRRRDRGDKHLGRIRIDIPIAVVVNGNTASAAELFTSAMRDYGRAKIVGTTTYGKGCMQTFYPLSDGSVFKVTTAMYYPPYSDNYDGVGIVPDREVELDESLHGKSLYVITDEEDNQLAAAYDILK